MEQTDISMFLQSLRGNQPMIALAFLLMRRSLTIEDLEAATGLHNDTVRAAVKGLASKGLLLKQTGERGRQTWVPLGGTFFARLASQNPKTSDSEPVVVNVVESERSDKLLSASTTLKRQNPKTSDSGLSGEELLNLAALKDAGIVGRKARELATLPWVTPEYVQAHVEGVKAEPWDNPLGMVIYRIEGEVVPADTKERRQFNRRTIDLGKRGKLTTAYDFDVDQYIADFMGHEKGCTCLDCRMLLSANGDTRVICPDCKHYHCECNESE